MSSNHNFNELAVRVSLCAGLITIFMFATGIANLGEIWSSLRGKEPVATASTDKSTVAPEPSSGFESEKQRMDLELEVARLEKEREEIAQTRKSEEAAKAESNLKLQFELLAAQLELQETTQKIESEGKSEEQRQAEQLKREEATEEAQRKERERVLDRKKKAIAGVIPSPPSYTKKGYVLHNDGTLEEGTWLLAGSKGHIYNSAQLTFVSKRTSKPVIVRVGADAFREISAPYKGAVIGHPTYHAVYPYAGQGKQYIICKLPPGFKK